MTSQSDSPRPLTRCKPGEHRWVYTRPKVGGVGYVCEKCGAVREDIGSKRTNAQAR